MSFVSGYLVLAGRGVGGATFAIGAELLVDISELDLIAEAQVDTQTVIVDHSEQSLTIAPEVVELILAPADGALTVE